MNLKAIGLPWASKWLPQLPRVPWWFSVYPPVIHIALLSLLMIQLLALASKWFTVSPEPLIDFQKTLLSLVMINSPEPRSDSYGCVPLMYSRTLVHERHRDESNHWSWIHAPLQCTMIRAICIIDPDQDYRSYFVVFPELQSYLFLSLPLLLYLWFLRHHAGSLWFSLLAQNLTAIELYPRCDF